MWRDIQKRDPESFTRAVKFDATLRRNSALTNVNNDLFLHRSLKPLDQVDVSTDEDRGQLNMFNNECEGMCGV